MKKIIFTFSFLVILALFPIAIKDDYSFLIDRFVLIFLSFFIALSINLNIHYLNRIFLGATGFWAIGAYCTAILTTKWGFNPFMTTIIGICLTTIISFILGLIILKLEGPYFALATFAFAMIVITFINKFISLTGGASGIFDIPNYSFFTSFDTNKKYYYFLLILSSITYAVTYLIFHNRWGEFLLAFKESKKDMLIFGYNPFYFELLTFIYSSILISISGSIYACFMNYINPTQFSILESVNFLSMSIIGGSSYLLGAFVGSLFFHILSELFNYLRDTLSIYALDQLQIVLWSVILIFFIIFLPGGIISILFLKSKEKIKC